MNDFVNLTLFDLISSLDSRKDIHIEVTNQPGLIFNDVVLKIHKWFAYEFLHDAVVSCIKLDSSKRLFIYVRMSL